MLEGSLVRLRAREKTDLDRVHRWINDREVTQYLLARYPLSRAAEEKWLEASSCSNFEDFQARRSGIRFRRESTGKVGFVHTLNGSGLATSRLIVALMETHQTDEGTIRVPEALIKYTGFGHITPEGGC